MGAHRPQAGLSPRGDRCGERSRGPKFLCAAGYRGRLPASADIGSSGRQAVQAAGVYQDVFHDHCGGASDHARSGHAAPVYPHEKLGGSAAPVPPVRLLLPHRKNYEFRPRCLARVTNAVLVGPIHSEETHPISKILIRLCAPVCELALRCKWFVIAGAIALVILTVPVFERLGSEFMPPLDEGSLMYMPSTLPGISVTQAQQ